MTNPTPEFENHYPDIVIEHRYRPGDLLHTRKVPLPGLTQAAQGWQIVYASTDSYGELIAVSGMVLTPRADAPGVDAVLVYCPAFHGLGGPAPSELLAEGRETEADRIDAALEHGFIVAVPDGEGLGAGTGPHTFLAARAAAHTVLDIARATARLTEIDADPAHTVVWGYADGGRTAVTAAELHSTYAPEVPLRGVSAGAVVADPGELAAQLADSRWAALNLAGLIGLSTAHRHLPLLHVLSDEGRQIAVLAAKLPLEVLLEQFGQPLGHWCERDDPWADPMWRYVLAREKTGLIIPQIPVHLYHGTHDALVPVQHAHALYTHYRTAGAAASWHAYDTDHLSAATDGVAQALSLLTDDLGHATSPEP
ncbi:lipase family protein [Nocardia sp. CA2R105]|uniref:lipase family protein n=1 Tax=Nocardia coffeae TaxID=2873381 RepID=UPI001CA72F3B|nr:lipase family protein [Nocardia coffeae]MBY8862047.1 lipase family protein [Nocardia coffeae]